MTFSPCPLDAWLEAQLPPGLQINFPQRLAQAQNLALQQTLQRANQHSPFYRAHLAHAPQIATVEELPLLPFTTAAHLVEWRKFLCLSQGAVARMVTLNTSGTTGPPKRLAFSEADLRRTVDFFRVGMSQVVRAGQTLLVLLPGAERPNGVSDLLRQALPDVHVHAGHPQATPETLREDMERCLPHALVAMPDQLQRLHHCCQNGSIQAACTRNLAHGGILASAGLLPPRLTRLLKQNLACLTLDHYGLTEAGYGGGVQCPAHDGYHLRELDILVEIIDIDSGRSLPPEQTGEVVITTLQREAMPLIRYRTGDVAALLPGPCVCASPLRRLGPIQGRLVREGTNFRILSLPKGALHAGLVQTSL